MFNKPCSFIFLIRTILVLIKLSSILPVDFKNIDWFIGKDFNSPSEFRISILFMIFSFNVSCFYKALSGSIVKLKPTQEKTSLTLSVSKQSLSVRSIPSVG